MAITRRQVAALTTAYSIIRDAVSVAKVDADAPKENIDKIVYNSLIAKISSKSIKEGGVK